MGGGAQRNLVREAAAEELAELGSKGSLAFSATKSHEFGELELELLRAARSPVGGQGQGYY